MDGNEAAVAQMKEMFPDLDEELLATIYVQNGKSIEQAIDACFSFAITDTAPEDQVRHDGEVCGLCTLSTRVCGCG
jgi:hypothetical protein